MITILFDFTHWRVNKTTLRRAETNPTGPSCFAPGQICGAAVQFIQSVVNILYVLGFILQLLISLNVILLHLIVT